MLVFALTAVPALAEDTADNSVSSGSVTSDISGESDYSGPDKTGGESPAPAIKYVLLIITGDDVNIRSRPSTSGSLLRKSNIGDHFIAEADIVKDSGGMEWRQIVAATSVVGEVSALTAYVSAAYSRVSELPASLSSKIPASSPRAAQTAAPARQPSGAAEQPAFSNAELKLMSTFLSNFTEVGLINFDASDVTNENDPADMIRFGILHNYINNYSNRIALCKEKGCKWGLLVIDGKHVKESVNKYFGYDLKKLPSVTESTPPYYYDGNLYHFAGVEGETIYYARVDKAARNASGQIVMTGELYNSEDEKDKRGKFEAVAKPYRYSGRNTWAIVSMRTEY